MAKKIYKLHLMKPSEAWYQLSEEEQQAQIAKWEEAREKVGAKEVIICESGWSSERWPYFGLEEFPDVEAVQKHTELLNEMKSHRYADSMSLLGTEMQSPD